LEVPRGEVTVTVRLSAGVEGVDDDEVVAGAAVAV